MEALVGQSVTDHRVNRHIGGGGMAVVYEAEDTRLGAILPGNPEFERLYPESSEGG